MVALASLIVNIKGDSAELVQAVEKADKSTSSLGDKIGKMGPLLATGVAAGATAFAAIGASAINAASEAQSATNKLQAQLGLTSDEAKRLGDVAKDVFKNNFGGSISEAADAVTKVTSNLGPLVSGDQIKGLTEHAFRLADAFGIDVAESTSAVRTLMDNFGLSADKAFDLVTTGMQRGLDRSGDFLDTVNEYSTQFASGGASAEQFFSLLENGLAGGALGTDKAADSFKEFGIRVSEMADPTKQALKDIGLNAEDIAAKIASGQMTSVEAFNLVTGALTMVDDKTKQYAAAQALLGTQFEDLGARSLEMLSTTGQGFDDVAGKTQALDVQYQSLGAVWEGLKRKAIVDFLIPLGDKLLELVNVVVPAFNAALSTITGWVDANSPKIKAALGAMWDDFGAKVQAGIAAALPLLQSFGESAQRHFETAKAAVGDAWTAMQPVIEEIRTRLDDFKALILPEFAAAWESIQLRVEAAINALQPPVERVLSAIQQFWTDHGDAIQRVAEAAWTFIEQTVNNATAVISNVIQLVLNVIQGDWSGAWSNIQNIAATTWDQIKNLVQLSIDALPAIVEIGVGLVKTALDLGWEAAKSLTETAWRLLKEAVSKGIDEAVEFVKGLPGKVTAAMGDMSTLLAQKGRDLVQGFINGITEKAKDVPGAVGSMIKDGVGEFAFWSRSPWPFTIKKGEEFTEGFINGILSKAKTAREAVRLLIAGPVEEIEQATAPIRRGLNAWSGANAAHAAMRDWQATQTADSTLTPLTDWTGGALTALNNWTDLTTAQSVAELTDEVNRLYDGLAPLNNLRRQYNEILATATTLTEEERAAIAGYLADIDRQTAAIHSRGQQLAAYRDAQAAVAKAGEEAAAGIAEVGAAAASAAPAVTTADSAAKALWGTLSKVQDTAANAGYLAGNTLAANLFDGLKAAAIHTAVKVQSEVGNILHPAFQRAEDYGRSMGDAVAYGMAEGIDAASREPVAAVERMSDELVAALKKRLGIASPSRVFHAFGEDTLRGYLGGLQAMAKTVHGWVTDFTGAIVAAVNATVTDTQLAYQQGLAALHAPGTLSGGDLYAEAMESTAARRAMDKNAGFRFGPEGQKAIARMGNRLGMDRPAVNLNFYGPVVGGEAGMQQLAGMINAQLGAMGGI